MQDGIFALHASTCVAAAGVQALALVMALQTLLLKGIAPPNMRISFKLYTAPEADDDVAEPAVDICLC